MNENMLHEYDVRFSSELLHQSVMFESWKLCEEIIANLKQISGSENWSNMKKIHWNSTIITDILQYEQSITSFYGIPFY